MPWPIKKIQCQRLGMVHAPQRQHWLCAFVTSYLTTISWLRREDWCWCKFRDSDVLHDNWMDWIGLNRHEQTRLDMIQQCHIAFTLHMILWCINLQQLGKRLTACNESLFGKHVSWNHIDFLDNDMQPPVNTNHIIGWTPPSKFGQIEMQEDKLKLAHLLLWVMWHIAAVLLLPQACRCVLCVHCTHSTHNTTCCSHLSPALPSI